MGCAGGREHLDPREMQALWGSKRPIWAGDAAVSCSKRGRVSAGGGVSTAEGESVGGGTVGGSTVRRACEPHANAVVEERRGAVAEGLEGGLTARLAQQVGDAELDGKNLPVGHEHPATSASRVARRREAGHVFGKDLRVVSLREPTATQHPSAPCRGLRASSIAPNERQVGTPGALPVQSSQEASVFASSTSRDASVSVASVVSWRAPASASSRSVPSSASAVASSRSGSVVSVGRVSLRGGGGRSSDAHAAINTSAARWVGGAWVTARVRIGGPR